MLSLYISGNNAKSMGQRAHPNICDKPFLYYIVKRVQSRNYELSTFFLLCGSNPTCKRPNLLTCGIEQRVYCTDLFHTQIHTVAQRKHRKSSQTGQVCSGLRHCAARAKIIVASRVTYLWWQCGVFRRGQNFESFRVLYSCVAAKRSRTRVVSFFQSTR